MIVESAHFTRKTVVPLTRQTAWKAMTMQALLQTKFSTSYQPLMGEMILDNAKNTLNAEELNSSRDAIQANQTSRVNVVIPIVNKMPMSGLEEHSSSARLTNLTQIQVFHRSPYFTEQQSCHAILDCVSKTKSTPAIQYQRVIQNNVQKKTGSKSEETLKIDNCKTKTTALQRKLDEVNRFCCNSYKMKTIFHRVPFDSFNRHKDMYLKTMRSFMFEHKYLDYSTVFVYKIDSRLTKIEIKEAMLNVKGNDNHILV